MRPPFILVFCMTDSLIADFLASIMFFFNSSSLRAVSLDSWLSRLKSWLQPDHDYESQGDRSHEEKTSYDIHFNPVLLCPHSPLSLDLPSPTASIFLNRFKAVNV